MPDSRIGRIDVILFIVVAVLFLLFVAIRAAALPVGAAPIDTDGDGCSDGEEGAQGTDPNNPYDFFDTNKDGSITISDFLAVVEKFGFVGDYPLVDRSIVDGEIGPPRQVNCH